MPFEIPVSREGPVWHQSAVLQVPRRRYIVKIAVLSDTHNLLRPEVLEQVKGCELILHGGDVSRQSVLDQLEGYAPVHVVRGNNDKEWAEHIPQYLDITLAGLRIFMVHKKKDLPEDLTDYDLVIYGHSHRFELREQGHTILLNPGSCGPRRFHQEISMAIVELENGKAVVTRVVIPHAEIINQKTTEIKDLKQQIEIVMRETQKGKNLSEIASRHGIDPELAEQIARLYVTHPGVTAEGIMTKMGL